MAADHYIGSDRRTEQRRLGSDRRQAIRFELEKTPRRSSNDRRKHGETIWEGRDRF